MKQRLPLLFIALLLPAICIPILLQSSPAQSAPTPKVRDGDTLLFSDSFEDVEQPWLLDEEIVDEGCYRDAIGIGSHFADLTAPDGGQIFRVDANAALSPFSNHVIAYYEISEDPVQGLIRVTLYSKIFSAHPGQTGPEVSIQNTAPTSTDPLITTTVTTIAAFQYVNNPDAGEDRGWAIWTLDEEGSDADWHVIVPTNPMGMPNDPAILAVDSWYRIDLLADFDSHTYLSIDVSSFATGQVVVQENLSNYPIVLEDRGKAVGFNVTLEAENLYQTCPATTPVDYTVFYDDLAVIATTFEHNLFLPVAHQ